MCWNGMLEWNMNPYLPAMQELKWDLETHLELQQVDHPQDKSSILPLFCKFSSRFILTRFFNDSDFFKKDKIV